MNRNGSNNDSRRESREGIEEKREGKGCAKNASASSGQQQAQNEQQSVSYASATMNGISGKGSQQNWPAWLSSYGGRRMSQQWMFGSGKRN
eukprot:2568214-Amphidinium_carterae.2